MAEHRYCPQEGDGPLCPMDNGGNSRPAHQAVVRTMDAYDTALRAAWPPDADGEMPPEADSVAVAGYKVQHGMDLYAVSSSTVYQGSIVEAWYFRCPVCGFILPASGVTHRG